MKASMAAIIGPIDGDRPFGEDIERLIQAQAAGLDSGLTHAPGPLDGHLSDLYSPCAATFG